MSDTKARALTRYSMVNSPKVTAPGLEPRLLRPQCTLLCNLLKEKGYLLFQEGWAGGRAQKGKEKAKYTEDSACESQAQIAAKEISKQ